MNLNIPATEKPHELLQQLSAYRNKIADYLASFDAVIEVLRGACGLPPYPTATPTTSPPVIDTSFGPIPGAYYAGISMPPVPPSRAKKPQAKPQPATRREKRGVNEIALWKALEATPGEFRNLDLIQWLEEHDPEAHARISKSTGAVSIFLTKLKERGLVEFVRKEGLSTYNRKTKAFKTPTAGDSVAKWEDFKFGALGMPKPQPEEA